ncbi:hypothetical protein ASE67_09440 [Sphingomonas sp. Leaf23]|nr:hypothetical protein ASE67_09440 [Sphingomonas sp. Leaf23]
MLHPGLSIVNIWFAAHALPFGSSSFEPVEKRASRTGRLGKPLLDRLELALEANGGEMVRRKTVRAE